MKIASIKAFINSIKDAQKLVTNTTKEQCNDIFTFFTNFDFVVEKFKKLKEIKGANKRNWSIIWNLFQTKGRDKNRYLFN